MPPTRDKWQQMMQGILHGQARFLHDFELARGPLGGTPRHGWHPATDVCETDDAIVVRVEVAGVRPEDIEVVLEDEQLLTVRGMRRDSMADKRRGYHQMEIHYGMFQRHVYIPKAVNAEGARARYEQGFLEIMLPIAEHAAHPARFVVAISV